MTEMDHIIFFNGHNRNNRRNLVTWSITKKQQYIRISIGKNIASQIGFDVSKKIKFGCNKSNNTEWYLVCDNNGYTPTEGRDFYLIMIPSPFKSQEIKMQKMINKKDFEIIDSILIKLNVSQFFKNNKLLYRN